MLLEICANSYQSAINAQEAGVHRIELCSELALGGITPSYGLLEKVMQELTIPVFVLIRPRSGDFTYTDTEFDIMLRDIAQCKRLGVYGIVSGVLQQGFTIDTERTQELIKACGDMQFTFHRAFDWVPDPIDGLETLAALGVDRILTSGQEKTAAVGLETLKKLHKQADGRITILPGGGINPTNIGAFIQAGFDEVHASASSYHKHVKGKLPMENINAITTGIQSYSDPEKIRQLLTAITANR